MFFTSIGSSTISNDFASYSEQTIPMMGKITLGGKIHEYASVRIQGKGTAIINRDIANNATIRLDGPHYLLIKGSLGSGVKFETTSPVEIEFLQTPPGDILQELQSNVVYATNSLGGDLFIH